jgi:hypothetical protein
MYIFCIFYVLSASHGDYPLADIHFSGPPNELEHFLYSAFRISVCFSCLLYCIIFNFMTFSLNLSFHSPFSEKHLFIQYGFCVCDGTKNQRVYAARIHKKCLRIPQKFSSLRRPHSIWS